MAVPSSGELKLWDNIWNQELGGAQGENSLHSASVYAGFSTPDAMSDFYGWSDVEVPAVSTSTSTSITTNSMVLNGNVSSTGNENPSRGFYFGTNSSAANNNTKYNVGTGGVGAFSCNKTGLSYYTTYYNWAFACNSAGEAQGGRITTTTAAPPFTPSCAGCTFTQLCAYSCGCDCVLMNNSVSQGYYNPYTGGAVGLASCSDYCSGTTVTDSVCVNSTIATAFKCVVTNAKNYKNSYSCARGLYRHGAGAYILSTACGTCRFNNITHPSWNFGTIADGTFMCGRRSSSTNGSASYQTVSNGGSFSFCWA